MITDEQFVNRVLDSFDKINAKIDDLHRETGDQIKILCDKIAKAQKSIDDHILVLTTKKEIDENITRNRDKKFYVIIALMGILFSVYEITKDLI